MLASIAVISAITHRFNLPAIADAAKKLRCHEDELIRAMQPGQRDNERMLQPVPRRATAERRLACRAMGERIALLRKRLKLSQGDLAELLDVRQETISAWERGVNEVQVFDAVALADTLHVPRARRMSFFLTTRQVLAREKTVTRRSVSTWTALTPGDRLIAIEKGQGLKAGEGHNVRIMPAFARYKRVLAVMATGCHERGQLIMLADGSARRVEDIAVGDLLMGPDLTPRTVLSLARGRQEMRRIIPETGPAWVVNLDHVLTLANGGDDLGLRDPSSWIDITVREYLREQRGEWHPLSLIRVTPTGRALVPFWTEKMPEDDYFGFTLDGDHRYLLADGTVTHNCGKTEVYLAVIRRYLESAKTPPEKRAMLIAHRDELADLNGSPGRCLCPAAGSGAFARAMRAGWTLRVATCGTAWRPSRTPRSAR